MWLKFTANIPVWPCRFRDWGYVGWPAWFHECLQLCSLSAAAAKQMSWRVTSEKPDKWRWSLSNSTLYTKSLTVSWEDIGKGARDNVSVIRRVEPLQCFTRKLYRCSKSSILRRRRGADARERLKITSRGLWFVSTVMSALAKSSWSKLWPYLGKGGLRSITIKRVFYRFKRKHVKTPLKRI